MSSDLRDRRAWAPLALVGAAAAAAAWTTREHTALPSPAWLAAVVALGLVVALRRPGTPRPSLDLPLAALVGLASTTAHLERGLLLGHDTLHHVWGAAAYLQAWSGGDLLPLWLHGLGLGMPLPLFYGPLPFWAMAPFALAGGGPAQMLAGSFVLAGIVAALAAWQAVAVWTGDRRAALLAAAAWSYAPYRLLDANYRAALGETWALAVLPLALVAFDRLLAAPGRRRFVVAALVIAFVTLAHPLSLLPLAVTLIVLFAARLPRLAAAGAGPALRAAGRSTAAGAAGIALAGFFAVPLVVGMPALNITSLLDGPGGHRYREHGLDPGQLVERRLWSGLEWSRPDESPADDRREMPIYFGLVLLAGLAGGVVARRGPPAARERPLLAFAVVGFVLLLLTLRPLAHLLSTLETFALMQYPWRFLGPASAAAVLALSGLASPAPSFSAGGRPRGGWLAAAILALAVLGDGFAFSGAASRAAPWQGLAVPADRLFATGVVRFETVPKPWPQRSFGIFLPPWECCADVAEVYSEYSEYFTPAARRTAARFAEAGIGQVMRAAGELEPIDALPYARLWRPGAGTPRALRYQRGGGRIEVRIPRGAHGRLEVAEQNFPGWRVERRGEWTAVAATGSGLLAVDVPRGTRRIRFEFHRWTWEKNLGRILSLVTALGLGLLLVRARRGRASPAEAA